MADAPLDLEALLAPLATGEGGAGENLREDFSPSSPYQRLKDARFAARAEERARDGEGVIDAPPPDAWREVARVGQEALANRAKDFEIAAWLAEAMVRQAGLPGLTASAKLITGLCETYWEHGFPLPDEDGLDGRAAPLGGLAGSGGDGTIMQPLRLLPLFRRADGTPLTLYVYDQAEETAGIANEERRAARLAAGVPEMALLEAEARLDRAHVTRVTREAREALEAWQAMDAAAGARFGSEAPATRNVRMILERIIEVVVRLGGGEALVEGATEAVAEAGTPWDVGAKPGAAPGALRSREDAFRELERVAEFFRRTEPHSPLSYTLEEAVRRGRMSLAELLAEVLPDEDARHGLLARLGIRPDGLG
jgi:type VI secretion system protein ImpA